MLQSESQLFEGLPVRFGCAGEKNPNRAFEKFVTRLVLETLSLSGYEVVSQFPNNTSLCFDSFLIALNTDYRGVLIYIRLSI